MTTHTIPDLIRSLMRARSWQQKDADVRRRNPRNWPSRWAHEFLIAPDGTVEHVPLEQAPALAAVRRGQEGS